MSGGLGERVVAHAAIAPPAIAVVPCLLIRRPDSHLAVFIPQLEVPAVGHMARYSLLAIGEKKDRETDSLQDQVPAVHSDARRVLYKKHLNDQPQF